MIMGLNGLETTCKYGEELDVRRTETPKSMIVVHSDRHL